MEKDTVIIDGVRLTCAHSIGAIVMAAFQVSNGSVYLRRKSWPIDRSIFRLESIHGYIKAPMITLDDIEGTDWEVYLSGQPQPSDYWRLNQVGGALDTLQVEPVMHSLVSGDERFHSTCSFIVRLPHWQPDKFVYGCQWKASTNKLPEDVIANWQLWIATPKE